MLLGFSRPWHILLAEDDVRQGAAMDAQHHHGTGEEARRGLQLQFTAEGHEVQRCGRGQGACRTMASTWKIMMVSGLGWLMFTVTAFSLVLMLNLLGKWNVWYHVISILINWIQSGSVPSHAVPSPTRFHPAKCCACRPSSAWWKRRPAALASQLGPRLGHPWQIAEAMEALGSVHHPVPRQWAPVEASRHWQKKANAHFLVFVYIS